jgi:hypothetical protein
MKKFNGFEKYLIVKGLTKLATEMKADIRNMEEEGKRPLMTVGYIDMVLLETLDKVDTFTVKEKKSR